MNKIVMLILVGCMVEIVEGQTVVRVYAHKWCFKSKVAVDIGRKLEMYYPEVQYDFVEAATEEMVLPRMEFECRGRRVVYENDLKYMEVEYWLALICGGEIPNCRKWMDPSHTYHLHCPPTQSILSWAETHPETKLCRNSSLPYTLPPSISALNTVSSFPYFHQFSHNLRHSILINQQTVIAYLYRRKSGKVGKFRKHYQMLRRNDKKLGYWLQEQVKEQLVFMEEKIDSKMGRKLMGFLGLQFEEGVVGFRFEGEDLRGVPFVGELDNKFTFWVEKITQHQFAQQGGYCASDEVVHYYQENSLQSIRTNLQFLQLMTTYPSLPHHSRARQWVSHNPFQLCISRSSSQTFPSLSLLKSYLQNHFSQPEQL